MPRLEFANGDTSYARDYTGHGQADVIHDGLLAMTYLYNDPSNDDFEGIEFETHVITQDVYDDVDYRYLYVAADSSVVHDDMDYSTTVSGERTIHDTWTVDGVTSSWLGYESYGPQTLEGLQGFAPWAYFQDAGTYAFRAPPATADFTVASEFWLLDWDEMGLEVWAGVYGFGEQAARWMVGDELIDDPSLMALLRLQESWQYAGWNAGIDTVNSFLSIGGLLWDDAPLEIFPTDGTGYQFAYLGSRVVDEFLLAYFTSGASVLSKVGWARKALVLWDTAGNAWSVTRGLGDAYLLHEGWTFDNILQVLGGAAGLKGNFAGGLRVRIPNALGMNLANGRIGFADEVGGALGAAAGKVDDVVPHRIELRPYGGPGGGHHLPAKKALEGAGGYDLNAALAIPNEVLKKLKLDHPTITGVQASLYRAFAKTGKPLTWDVVEEIETKALIRGGANAVDARSAVQRAIQALKDAGVPGPTRIPWGG